jgi:hypothetical protein
VPVGQREIGNWTNERARALLCRCLNVLMKEGFERWNDCRTEVYMQAAVPDEAASST